MEAADVPLLESNTSKSAVSHEQGESFEGLRSSSLRSVLFLLACVFSFGLIYLAARWFLSFRVKLQFSSCALREAEYVLITEDHPQVGEPGQSLAQVQWTHDSRRTLLHKGLIFSFNADAGTFENHTFAVQGKPFAALHELGRTMTAEKRQLNATLFGRNEMPVPTPSVFDLVLQEVLSPFYIFQVGSIIIWMLQLYWVYSLCIFVLATAGIVWSVVQSRRNNAALAEMAHHSSQVAVMRGSHHAMTDSTQLVPGDVVLLEDQTNSSLPCDVVLLSGECVMNEASLTGETTPVLKAPLPSTGDVFNFAAHHRHVLFGGTQLRQARGKPQALVVRTAFQTSKGELIRQMMFPKKQVFQFYRDAMVFIGVLCVACLGFVIWSWWRFQSAGASALTIFIRVVDLYTVLIPPALPIAITAGTTLAVARLRQRGIFCVVPRAVALAGRVNLFCFDKTGTLTEDFMNVAALLPSSASGFQKAISDVSQMGDKNDALLHCVASCHSVIKVNNSELIGDPMEVKMLEWSHWKLSSYDDSTQTVTSPTGSDKVTLVHRHEFSSTLARMSVVVQTKGGERVVFVKGSPKEIRSRCKSLPSDFDHVLNGYTAQGMRLIALATRALGSASPQDRDAVERDLTLLGLLVLRNPIKDTSYSLVQSLVSARIRPVMITGDNALTAIAVSRTLGIIDVGADIVLVDDNNNMTTVGSNVMSDPEPLHWDEALSRGLPLALTGGAFETAMASGHATAVLQACSVYARAQPLQKMDIVHAFQNSGNFTVGMCGDGSNDCGALKMADMGLSISDGEAAIAAPFSARTAHEVLDVVLEGRCALATSFTLFKFMILYSIVQFTGIMICYTEVSLFSDLQFLWIDLFTILPLACTLGLTPPIDRLLPARPPASMLCMSSIVSIIGHTVIAVVPYALFCTVWGPAQTSFWVPATPPANGKWNTRTMLVTLAWKIGNLIYVTQAYAFSIGRPFRRPFWYNPALLLAFIATTICGIVWFFVTNARVTDWFSVVQMPSSFLGSVFGATVAVCVAIYVWEVVVINFFLPRNTSMEPSKRSK